MSVFALLEVIGQAPTVSLVIMEKFLTLHLIFVNVNGGPNGMDMCAPRLIHAKVANNGMYFLSLVNAHLELSGMAHIVFTEYLVVMEKFPTPIMNVSAQMVHIGLMDGAEMLVVQEDKLLEMENANVKRDTIGMELYVYSVLMGNSGIKV